MMTRRSLLLLSVLAWLGMMGALGFRTWRQRAQSAGAAGYLESIFGENVPVLVTKSIWVEDTLGIPKQVGTLEQEVQHVGGNRARVTLSADVRAKELPPLALGMLAEVGIEPQDVETKVDVFLSRLGGLESAEGDFAYGKEKWVFRVERIWKRLRVSTRHGPESWKRSSLAYDPNLPQAFGLSPFVGVKDLKPGMSWSVSHLNPLTRKPEKLLIRVDREASLTYKGRSEKCFVLTAHPAAAANPGPGPAPAASYGLPTGTGWVTPDGRLLREEAQYLFFKIALVLENSISAEEARKDSLEEGAAKQKEPRR